MCPFSIVIFKVWPWCLYQLFPTFIVTLEIMILSAKSQVWRIDLITLGYKADKSFVFSHESRVDFFVNVQIKIEEAFSRIQFLSDILPLKESSCWMSIYACVKLFWWHNSLKICQSGLLVCYELKDLVIPIPRMEFNNVEDNLTIILCPSLFDCLFVSMACVF